MLADPASKTCNFWTLGGDSFSGALGMANAGDSAWTRALAGALLQGKRAATALVLAWRSGQDLTDL